MVVSGAQTAIGFNGETICGDNNNFVVMLLDLMINQGLSLEGALKNMEYDNFTNKQYLELVEIAGNSTIKIREEN